MVEMASSHILQTCFVLRLNIMATLSKRLTPLSFFINSKFKFNKIYVSSTSERTARCKIAAWKGAAFFVPNTLGATSCWPDPATNVSSWTTSFTSSTTMTACRPSLLMFGRFQCHSKGSSCPRTRSCSGLEILTRSSSSFSKPRKINRRRI